jgi:hypothetical protein
VLTHRAHLVGDDGDGAEVVGVEVARQRGLIRVGMPMRRPPTIR